MAPPRSRQAGRGERPSRSRPTGAGADERLLAALCQLSGPVSGAALARSLGVSRAAVWKRVLVLRRRGYRIEAVRGRGYSLVAVPDLLGPAELGPLLATRTFGRHLHCFERVDSTNRVARDLARAGAPEGTVVIADAQSAGRGRLGRRWESPPGVNLYCSIVLRPPLAPDRAPQLGLVAGTAVAAAIGRVAGCAPAIKWPNDLLVGGRKVAGILTEIESEADRIHFVVVGIGVNLNSQPGDFPASLRRVAGSLAMATGRPVARARFAADLLGALEERYRRYLAQGLAAVRAQWEAASCLTGTEVAVAVPGGRLIEGKVLGLDGQGALRLRLAGGTIARVLAGDVHVVAQRGRGPSARAH